MSTLDSVPSGTGSASYDNVDGVECSATEIIVNQMRQLRSFNDVPPDVKVSEQVLGSVDMSRGLLHRKIARYTKGPRNSREEQRIERE